MRPLSKMEELVVAWCVDTLANDPDDWSSDTYWLTHKSKTRIWVGNPEITWAFKVETPDFRIEGPCETVYARPGLFARLGFCPPPQQEWRLQLRTAFERWQQRNLDRKIMDWVKAR